MALSGTNWSTNLLRLQIFTSGINRFGTWRTFLADTLDSIRAYNIWSRVVIYAVLYDQSSSFAATCIDDTRTNKNWFSWRIQPGHFFHYTTGALRIWTITYCHRTSSLCATRWMALIFIVGTRQFPMLPENEQSNRRQVGGRERGEERRRQK